MPSCPMPPKAGKNTLVSGEKPRESVTEEESEASSFDLELGKVRFSEALLRYDILSLDDYTKKELKKCWYTEEDKEKMNKSHNKLVRRYETGKRCKRNMTYRGLECWTDKGAAKLDEAISRTVDAVMDEQDAQWAAGVDNWNRISSLSRAVSKESRNKAREIAEEDRREARFAYETNEEEVGSDEDSTGTMFMLVKKKRRSRTRGSSTKNLTDEEKEARRARRRKSKSTKV